ncbi:MAG TPA: basic amino acid ABC transporter substrate-binding protein [Solirubrobacterales bacterium]|nr:basic amino acid ABC transporter substrate-binding protein [Solirubrobacterales bacterium]
MVAACGGGGGSTTGGGETSGGGEEGKPLTVGSDVPYPPFEEFGATKTEFKGFDVELMEAIGERIGREVEVQDTAFPTIFRDLGQGKFEAVASATTITPEREKTVDFTNPYYLSEQAIVVKEGSEIDSPEKLNGATVAVQQGTTGQKYVEDELEAGEIRPFPEGPDAVQAVQSGTSDAAVIDYPVAQDAVEKSSGIEIATAIPTEEEYGFVVSQNNEALLEELNEGLSEVKEDGTYARIYKTWFHKEPPKAILTATHKAS